MSSSNTTTQNHANCSMHPMPTAPSSMGWPPNSSQTRAPAHHSWTRASNASKASLDPSSTMPRLSTTNSWLPSAHSAPSKPRPPRTWLKQSTNCWTMLPPTQMMASPTVPAPWSLRPTWMPASSPSRAPAAGLGHTSSSQMMTQSPAPMVPFSHSPKPSSLSWHQPPKSTLGAVLMAFSFSTVKLGLTLRPVTMAVRLLGKERTVVL